jgi:hypothetical protein
MKGYTSYCDDPPERTPGWQFCQLVCRACKRRQLSLQPRGLFVMECRYCHEMGAVWSREHPRIIGTFLGLKKLIERVCPISSTS